MPKNKSDSPFAPLMVVPDLDKPETLSPPPKPDQENSQLLRVVLTEAELRETSHKLADKSANLNQIEEDKKRASSHYGSEVKAARAELTRLSQLVTSGYEIREVRCEVWFHKPVAGKKTTIRIDTGEIVNTVNMSSMEMQMRLPIA
jgi:hypothetical protein